MPGRRRPPSWWPTLFRETLMSGYLILAAFVVGFVLTAGVWIYGKQSSRGPGKVKPDAQPTDEEKRRQEPRSGSF
jgi:hypothetical protein